MNDSYAFAYAESLAECGRISEAFEIFNYINNNVCGHLPLSRIKSLSKCLIDYVLRLSLHNDGEHKSKFGNSRIYSDPLLCQICSPPDVLRCPVTAQCGHTFCKECLIQTLKCPVCNLPFAYVSMEANKSEKHGFNNFNQINTTHSSSTTSTTTTTYTFPSTSTSLVTSSATESTVSVFSATTNFLNNKCETIKTRKLNKNDLMPDILVRQIVEKWWSKELYARNMNDISMQYLKLNLLDEALKFCNDSLDKCEYI